MKVIDQRTEKRHPFHWKVAIVFDSTANQDTYHGITLDLSLSGCAILTDHNVYSEMPVTVLLSLPVETPGGRARIVEVKSQMVYTVLSSGHQQFRCGIHFLNFKGKGRSVLKRAVEARAMQGS